jgi:radical SAM protein with 4Fe4S-binding SPASM domain
MQVSYVGISLDGIGEINDAFRGVRGAFVQTVQGIRNCQNAGIRVGLRLTLTKRNVQDLERWFSFFETEGIERACFYHFVPCGRGAVISGDDLDHAQSREVIEMIADRTKQLKKQGKKTDILTVDNHVDGVYIYLKVVKENPARATAVWELLTWNGGGLNSSGIGIGCIDFNGKVHPDQFWSHYDLGDIHDRPFSEIWSNADEPLLKGLRNRREYVKGRCRVCTFFPACGGGLRVRADLYFSDPFAPEPACYLTDEEIGMDDDKKAQLAARGEVFQMP